MAHAVVCIVRNGWNGGEQTRYEADTAQRKLKSRARKYGNWGDMMQSADAGFVRTEEGTCLNRRGVKLDPYVRRTDLQGGQSTS
jgi:hypothetical protein